MLPVVIGSIASHCLSLIRKYAENRQIAYIYKFDALRYFLARHKAVKISSKYHKCKIKIISIGVNVFVDAMRK